MDTVMHTMHEEFHNISVPFRSFHTLFKTFDYDHKCCLKEPKLCPLKLYKFPKLGISVGPIIDTTN
jgi:hypothetical protein